MKLRNHSAEFMHAAQSHLATTSELCGWTREGESHPQQRRCITRCYSRIFVPGHLSRSLPPSYTHTHTVPRLRARFLTCRGQIRNSKLLGPRVVLTHDLKNPCFFLWFRILGSCSDSSIEISKIELELSYWFFFSFFFLNLRLQSWSNPKNIIPGGIHVMWYLEIGFPWNRRLQFRWLALERFR